MHHKTGIKQCNSVSKKLYLELIWPNGMYLFIFNKLCTCKHLSFYFPITVQLNQQTQ